MSAVRTRKRTFRSSDRGHKKRTATVHTHKIHTHTPKHRLYKHTKHKVHTHTPNTLIHTPNTKSAQTHTRQSKDMWTSGQKRKKKAAKYVLTKKCGDPCCWNPYNSDKTLGQPISTKLLRQPRQKSVLLDAGANVSHNCAKTAFDVILGTFGDGTEVFGDANHHDLSSVGKSHSHEVRAPFLLLVARRSATATCNDVVESFPDFTDRHCAGLDATKEISELTTTAYFSKTKFFDTQKQLAIRRVSNLDHFAAQTRCARSRCLVSAFLQHDGQTSAGACFRNKHVLTKRDGLLQNAVSTTDCTRVVLIHLFIRVTLLDLLRMRVRGPQVLPAAFRQGCAAS